MVEEQILTTLKNATTAGARVYALLAPQKVTAPFIVYQRISSAPINDLSGSSGLDRVRVQVDCYATTFAAAKELAAAVRPLMEAATFLGLLETDQDFYDPDTKFYRVSSDYFVWQQ